MGKKQHRKQHHKQHHKRTPQARTSAPRPAVADSPPPVEQARTGSRTSSSPSRIAATSWLEFRDRYRYVNTELKRIGILAGSFLVVLLVLTAILG